jgi:acetate kinase
MKILVLNAGSSSQKSCLYEFQAEERPIPSRPLWEAKIDWSHRSGLAELKNDESVSFRLSARARGQNWKLVFDTSSAKLIPQMLGHLTEYPLQARSVAVLGRQASVSFF